MVVSKGTIIEWNKIPINALVTGLFRMQYVQNISMHRIYDPFTIHIPIILILDAKNYVHTKGIFLQVRNNKKSSEIDEKEAHIYKSVRHYLLCKYGCEKFPVRRV